MPLAGIRTRLCSAHPLWHTVLHTQKPNRTDRHIESTKWHMSNKIWGIDIKAISSVAFLMLKQKFFIFSSRQNVWPRPHVAVPARSRYFVDQHKLSQIWDVLLYFQKLFIEQLMIKDNTFLPLVVIFLLNVAGTGSSSVAHSVNHQRGTSQCSWAASCAVGIVSNIKRQTSNLHARFSTAAIPLWMSDPHHVTM